MRPIYIHAKRKTSLAYKLITNWKWQKEHNERKIKSCTSYNIVNQIRLGMNVQMSFTFCCCHFISLHMACLWILIFFQLHHCSSFNNFVCDFAYTRSKHVSARYSSSEPKPMNKNDLYSPITAPIPKTLAHVVFYCCCSCVCVCFSFLQTNEWGELYCRLIEFGFELKPNIIINGAISQHRNGLFSSSSSPLLKLR